MQFCKDCFRVMRRLPLELLFDMYCSKFVITKSLYKPIQLVKLKFVFSPELHYMPDGLSF